MNIPELTPVESSNIYAVGFRLHDQSLYVQFKSKGGPDAIYRYIAVPPELYQRFLNSASKGGFFSREVKGHFAAEKLSPEVQG